MNSELTQGMRCARRLTPILLLSLLAGCSLIDAKKDDYKRASRLPPLEIPPSLSVPQADDRYSIPDPKDVAASATYSEYAKSRGLPTLPGGYVPGVGVDPQSTQAHIEKAGAERWLVVNGTPEQVWNTIKTFLTENSYTIAAENPTLGVLETEWVTSRPHVEDDGVLRNLINSLFTNDNSTSLRDRYRFRVEHGRKDGTTEIYVNHKGLEEVVSGSGSDHTIWQPRASEPDKEAEMLKQLLVKFGVDLPKADQQLAAATVEPRKPDAAAADVVAAAAQPVRPTAATLEIASSGQPRLLVADSFDRAWRRVGLAIDKSGLALQDQDRDEGVYFVQYIADKVQPANGGAEAAAAGGVLGTLSGFGRSIWHKLSGAEEEGTAQSAKVPDGIYRLTVSRNEADHAHVAVLDKTGQPAPDGVARSLLDLLAGSLR